MNAWILTGLCIAILVSTCMCMPQPIWDRVPIENEEMVDDGLEMHRYADLIVRKSFWKLSVALCFSSNSRQKRQLYGLGYYAYPAVIRRVYHTYPVYAYPFKKQ